MQRRERRAFQAKGKVSAKAPAKKDKCIIEEQKAWLEHIQLGRESNKDMYMKVICSWRKEGARSMNCVVAKTLHFLLCALKYCWKRLEWLKLWFKITCYYRETQEGIKKWEQGD